MRGGLRASKDERIRLAVISGAKRSCPQRESGLPFACRTMPFACRVRRVTAYEAPRRKSLGTVRATKARSAVARQFDT